MGPTLPLKQLTVKRFKIERKLNDLLDRELIRLANQKKNNEDTLAQDNVINGILLAIDEVRGEG